MSGVYEGDGYATDKNAFGLHVKDYEFVKAFKQALQTLTKKVSKVRTEGKYYRCVQQNRNINWRNIFKEYLPKTTKHKRLWLRGLFDSEGCVCLSKHKKGNACYTRRITISNTDKKLLRRAMLYFNSIGIASYLESDCGGYGHYRTKTIYKVRLIESRPNIKMFAKLVGTSISRKREKLFSCINTYKKNMSAHCRRTQAMGVIARNKRTEKSIVPVACKVLKEHYKKNKKLTTRYCGIHIQHYYVLVRRFGSHNKMLYNVLGIKHA